MLHGGDVAKAMESYPKLVNKEGEERANKYWVMYGATDDLQSIRYGSVVIWVIATSVYFVCIVLILQGILIPLSDTFNTKCIKITNILIFDLMKFFESQRTAPNQKLVYCHASISTPLIIML